MTADDGQRLFNDREAPLKSSQAYPDFDLISYGAIDRDECSLLGYHNEVPQLLSKQRRMSMLGSPRKIDVVDTIGLPRRNFLHLAAGAAALPAVSRLAWAQTYPSRPITIVVPFPAGGPTDTLARILAERMRRALGQAVIVENPTGAGGTIGTGRVARAAPDGYMD